MSEKSLNNLKTLWEKMDDQKTDIKDNQNKDPNSLDISILSYEKNLKWIPPDFAKLSTPDYSSKNSSNLFSMAYNEEKINLNYPNVSLYSFQDYMFLYCFPQLFTTFFNSNLNPIISTILIWESSCV